MSQDHNAYAYKGGGGGGGHTKCIMGNVEMTNVYLTLSLPRSESSFS